MDNCDNGLLDRKEAQNQPKDHTNKKEEKKDETAAEDKEEPDRER